MQINDSINNMNNDSKNYINRNMLIFSDQNIKQKSNDINVDVTQAMWKLKHCLHSHTVILKTPNRAKRYFVSVKKYPKKYPSSTLTTNSKNFTASIYLLLSFVV